MNCVLDVVGDDDADLDEVPGLVRAYQHHEVGLVVRAATGE